MENISNQIVIRRIIKCYACNPNYKHSYQMVMKVQMLNVKLNRLFIMNLLDSELRYVKNKLQESKTQVGRQYYK